MQQVNKPHVLALQREMVESGHFKYSNNERDATAAARVNECILLDLCELVVGSVMRLKEEMFHFCQSVNLTEGYMRDLKKCLEGFLCVTCNTVYSFIQPMSKLLWQQLVKTQAYTNCLPVCVR